MKGILLAGGSGSRLYPVTRAISKQLVPVYDKPLVYYPLSVLMLAGIRDILIITTQEDRSSFQKLFNNGMSLGLNIEYAVQRAPRGIAEALIIGRPFVKNDRVALILGDNIFYGHGLPEDLQAAVKRKSGATVFGYQVRDPQRYGVVNFDSNGRANSIVEKPKNPSSNWAVTGLYFYDNSVFDIVSKLKPSKRGELEITDVNAAYLKKKNLQVQKLGRGVAWLDTGTHDSLLQASHFIQVIEERQGLKVACLEEIALNLGYISTKQVQQLAQPMKNNGYGAYLMKVAERFK